MGETLKGLVVGIANDQSIAWGCAKAFHAAGAELAITYLNDKAKPHVEPLAQKVGAPIFLPLDVTNDAQMQALFADVPTALSNTVEIARRCNLEGSRTRPHPQHRRQNNATFASRGRRQTQGCGCCCGRGKSLNRNGRISVVAHTQKLRPQYPSGF